MDLEKYTELTGESVPANKQAKTTAVIRRTQASLEQMLGFSLKPKNLYTELGKSQIQGYLPIAVDIDNLLPADDEEGVYKLFPFNDTDKYFHIDPFTNVFSVKLVMPLNDGEFITITDLDNVVAQYGRDGIGKYIERHYDWFLWDWYETWRHSYAAQDNAGLMLAVDADWLKCYPDDLLYLWTDMISYYSDPYYSAAGLIKSESVDGHSWSRGTAGGGNSGDVSPENNLISKSVLKRYAGPYGTVLRNPVR